MQGITEDPVPRLVLFTIAIEVIDIEAARVGDKFGRLRDSGRVEVGLQVRCRNQVNIQVGQRGGCPVVVNCASAETVCFLGAARQDARDALAGTATCDYPAITASNFTRIEIRRRKC